MIAAYTDEGRAFLQERMALLGQVGAFIAVGFFAARAALTALVIRDWYGWADGDGLLNLLTAGVLAGVWLFCRGRVRGAATLAWLDALGTLGACLAAGLPMLLPDATLEYKYRALFAVANGLIARAALLPTPPGWTLGVSAAATMPVLGFTYLFHRAQGDPVGAAVVNALGALLWIAVPVAIAAITSRVIYGLRQEVSYARKLGQYTLEEKIGEGGMGEVYRARHALLRRPTAIKLLPPDRSSSDTLRRFEREVQLTSILTHPNTVAVYDYGRTPDGIFYYAMEYLDGLNLQELVRSHGPQPPARVVHILRQLCGSLAEAHSIGLIHRDVKPANVILSERGGVPDVVKLVDFGLVRAVRELEDVTGDTDIRGTPMFLAPEVMTAPEAVDARSDIYSLGALAYYLLTGEHVFTGRTVAEICGHHLHTTPVRPSVRLGAPLPAELEALVLQCLEKDPARRPQSARALLEKLDQSPHLVRWTDADARRWWADHGGGPTRAARKEEHLGVPLAVDLGDRTTRVPDPTIFVATRDIPRGSGTGAAGAKP